MKSILSALAIGVAISTSAFAHGPLTTTELLEVTKLAVADFTTAQPAHAEHLSGYKAWFSGEEAKVKIYVAHNGTNMEFNYTCHKHDELECHAQ